MPDGWMERMSEWTETNPLRRFRTKEKLPFHKTAAFLGVTVTTIQQWESGSNRPTDENMAKLAAFTGDKEIASEWSQWLECKPSIQV